VNIFYFLTDLPIIYTERYVYKIVDEDEHGDEYEHEDEHGDDYEDEYELQYSSHARHSFRLPTQKLQWEVTVSAIAMNGTYIALCEGEDPAESACYWITLGGWRHRWSNTCEIKRCPHAAQKLDGTTVAENDVSVIFQVH
jgi:hypothetical protein